MAKKDITITSDINSVGSLASKIKEREKALEELAKAKLIPRKVVFLKQGQSSYSNEFKRKEPKPELDVITIVKLCENLNVKRHFVEGRIKKYRLPFVMVGKSKCVEQSVFEKHLEKYPKREKK